MRMETSIRKIARIESPHRGEGRAAGVPGRGGGPRRAARPSPPALCGLRPGGEAGGPDPTARAAVARSGDAGLLVPSNYGSPGESVGEMTHPVLGSGKMAVGADHQAGGGERDAVED